MKNKKNFFIDPTAHVSSLSRIGQGTRIWHQAQIREGVIIGDDCIIAKGVYIDKDTKIGSKVKIQNYASLYHFTVLEDEVFIGPYVCFTNDLEPRAVNSKGELKGEQDWQVSTTTIKRGASIGAGTIILPGLTIGDYALVGAGSLVTKDVAPYSLIYGSPALLRGYVCKCGAIISRDKMPPKVFMCDKCQRL